MGSIKLLERDQTALNRVIALQNFKTTPTVHLKDGTEIGAGFTTKTYAVTIDESDKSTELFMKTLPECRGTTVNWDFFKANFQTELRFYQEILPTFQTFQSEKCIDDPFNNTPKYYGINEGELKDDCVQPIILENLKSFDYVLWDKRTNIHKHVCLIMNIYAKYHAISFAMKDQQPELFKKISCDLGDNYSAYFPLFDLDVVVQTAAQQVLRSLKPNDQDLYIKYNGLIDSLIHFSSTLDQLADEYSVINHGDSWPNNMMFKYDENGDPIDVKLCDFQAVRYNSPVLDFCNFLCAIATKEILKNIEYYLKLYHDTLRERIKLFGSDPEKIYPYSVFQEHWKKFAKFGLTVSFAVIKCALFDKDEVPDLLNSPNGKMPKQGFSANMKNQDEYNERMINLMRYFMDEGLV